MIRPAPAAPSPAPSDGPRRPPAGLRLADMVGLTVGFGLASLLARLVWPGFANLAGAPIVAFGLEFGWLGLAMSGPALLVLGRLGSGSRPARRHGPPSRPPRLGRPIGEVPAGERWGTPTASPLVGSPGPEGVARPEWTRAELAWLAIGSYWITLTLFIAGARAQALPGAVAGLIPVLAIFGLIVLVPAGLRRPGRSPTRGWTQLVALGLLWTWPVAWGLLVLLGRTL